MPHPTLRILALALLLAPAACAPALPEGSAPSAETLQSRLTGRTSDFGNGIEITWGPDGRFTYLDRYEMSGSDSRRNNRTRWGDGGTWLTRPGTVCLQFQGIMERCDRIIDTATGPVAVILGWPYRFTLR